MNKLFSLLLAFVFTISPVFAQNEVFTLKGQVSNSNEYFAGTYPGAVMMKVNLVGGVHRPGVYNVPVNSELNSVISYAGGPTKEADLDKVYVRSQDGSKYKVNKVDLKEFFADPKEVPFKLKPNDYIYVQQDEDFISNDVYRFSIVASTIIGAVLSALLIDRTLKD